MKTLLMLALLVVAAVAAVNYWNGAPLLSDPRTGRPAVARCPAPPMPATRSPIKMEL